MVVYCCIVAFILSSAIPVLRLYSFILYPADALKKHIYAISIFVTLHDMWLKHTHSDVYWLLRHYACSLLEIYHCVGGTYCSHLQGRIELHTHSFWFCHLIYWEKHKYTEVVVVASMDISLEENVEKTNVYFMSYRQTTGQYCNKNDESWVFYGGMVEASILLG